MGTTTARRPADWSMAPRNPASGALALATLSALGHDVAHLHPGWAVGAAAVGAVATIAAAGDLGPLALWHRLGCWIGAGGWLTWTLASEHGLWEINTAAALGVGALAAGVLAPLTRRTRPRPSVAGAPGWGGSQTSSAVVPRRYARLAEEWTARIHRCCNHLRVHIEDVQEWPTKTGYTFLILLPLGGITIDRLTNNIEGMANDARLPKGCGIEVVEGDLRGTVLMKVSTVNRLAADIDHPGDYSPRSALDGIVIGEHRDGSPTLVEVRQPRAIIVGTTGSAKTGTLHTVTCELGRCVDNLTWHMDLNGGGMSQAWLRPWLAGEVERPAIDWAAPCPEEAVLMSHAEVCIAKERKTAYSRRRMEADSQLLPIGKDVPQVTTVLDEGFEVLSPTIRDPLQRVIRDNVEETARIGRNEACQVLASALRSTSNTVSTDLLALFHNRIIMAGGAQKEIDYLYDYAKGPTVADLSGPGTGFIKTFASQEIRAWKAFYMKPKRDIYPASLAISRIRPDLDAPSVAAAGEAYRSRHDRMRWLFSTPEERARLSRPRPIVLPGVFDDRGDEVVWDPAVTHPAAGGEMSAASPSQEGGTVAGSSVVPSRRAGLTLMQGGATAGWGDPEQIAAASRRPTSSAPAEPLRAEQIHETVPAAPVPELLVRALKAFEGDDRIHSVVLAERLGVDQVELTELLRAIGVRTLSRAFVRGGEERRGYARNDLRAVADAIRRGDLVVPPEVATWPAA